MLSVLVTGFNRPDLLKGCLENLLDSKNVGKIYLHLDGPRSNNFEDANLVKSCKDIAETILLNTEHEFLFQTRNLGGRKSMQTAISWFYTKVDFGMVVEDDVRIHRDIPGILQNLEGIRSIQGLEKIGSISLYNPIAGTTADNPDIQIELSRYPMIWGWCSWRDVWSNYSNEITDSLIKVAWITARQRHLNLVAKKYWLKKFYTSRQSNTWDTQFLYMHWKYNYRTLKFTQNLSTNTGFDERATRTTNATNVAPIHCGKKLDLLALSTKLTNNFNADRNLSKKIWGLSYRNSAINLAMRIVPRKKSKLEKFKKSL